jgi:hypothetical protein
MTEKTRDNADDHVLSGVQPIETEMPSLCNLEDPGSGVRHIYADDLRLFFFCLGSLGIKLTH